MLANGKYVGAT